ncbi:uncharacterized protein Dvir_GJ16165, isoform B [Drosophila virilis]|nr:uncharacterized protein Dvir_GJ16165, isoform B [Drosophila virilis]
MDFETSKTYRPHVAVLHRCDENSSCCPTKTVWTAKNTTIVEKVFWVRSVGIPNSHPRIISLTNHTECHCISRAAQRRKRSSQCQCPKHFINFGVQQGGAPSSCRCDCHLSHTTCQRMKNGDEGFAVSELRCIRSNACSPPVCNYGLFNTTIGRCPRQLGFG